MTSGNMARDEHYIAIYLARELLGEKLSVEMLTGRPEQDMYLAVQRVASKYGVDSRDARRLASELLRGGYLRVDSDLKVYVNGLRYYDLLSSLKALPPERIEDLESRLALKLSKVYKPPDQPPSPGSPSALSVLSDKDAMKLPERGHLRRPSIDINKLKPRYLSGIGDPSKLTRYVVERRPDLVGGRKFDIVSEGSFCGIVVSDFVVQVLKVDTSGLGRNLFAVYRRDTKVGFVFAGRTCMDAVEEATRKYEWMLRRYSELQRRFAARGTLLGRYELRWKRTGGGYMIPYLYDTLTWEELFIDEGVLQEIRRRIAEKERESVGVASG